VVVTKIYHRYLVN